MKYTRSFIVVSALLVSLLAMAADEKEDWKLPPETARLKPGPGVELVTTQCFICHSADYISTQPPMTRAAWTATVTKMKEKYGAPITPESIEPVVNYLVERYGPPQNSPTK
jgi:sulfite dehydrogenase (cytochrome) subunit B